jgi:hypothetical protein
MREIGKALNKENSIPYSGAKSFKGAESLAKEDEVIKEISTIKKKPNIICSPSYVDFRSRANTTKGLDFDHMMR